MSGRPDHAAARWADDGVGEGAEAAEAAEAAGAADAAEAADAAAAAADDAVEAVEAVETGAVDAGAGEAAGGEVGAGEAGAGRGGQILTDVAALAAQRDEYLESLQRLKADFDNYRKRVARLQQEQSARAEANLITKLLPVLDNLDLAWAHLGQPDGGGEAGSEEARALGQARTQMLDLLAKEGLERLDAVNVPFDPTVHDAVAHVEVTSDAGGGGTEVGGGAHADAGQGPANGSTPHVVSVDQVLRAGYRWRGQVLRPAMVRVRG
jgi:molecular chaperone GrpE